MCLDHDRLFEPLKPIFFSYKNLQNKGNGHLTTPNKEFPAALTATGYA